MKANIIRWIILGASISVIGIVVTQVYWVRKAFTLEQREFEQSVKVALFRVAEEIVKYNQGTFPTENPVKMENGNVFFVRVDDHIDANILKHYLVKNLAEAQINTDFEYGIYDCSSEEMVYGDYISQDNSKSAEPTELPVYKEFIYYFTVRFPHKAAFIGNQMGIWIFSSIILLIVVIFFSLAIFIILKQKRLSEVQKDFINNMTHEFKTPISTISISADVFLDSKNDSKPERLRKYANIIKSEVNHLNNQVLRVLQMAKIDKGDNKLAFIDLNLNELIKEAIEGYQAKVEKRFGKITFKENTQANIRADEVHILNVINNLVDNAVHYCEQKPEITITISKTEKGYRLDIKDNGIGISKEYHRRIFGKFFRVPTGNVHNVKGFGLGLNYVANIVKGHGWKITLESEPGIGSTFSIHINN
ncbi:MAG: HAMP domain-containing histidine kinase [Bacteroidetes bacterium]|nr:HAMP domain-containing histidine kinase [Bacteroidota bacterium]